MVESTVKVTNSFLWHPKTLELKRRLGADGVLSLISLWLWANDNRPDGLLTGLDEQAIAKAAGWERKASDFLDACVEAGFLETGKLGFYAFHDWAENNEYAGLPLTLRERAQKAARARWDKVKAKA